jgi:hypothetical protein
VRIRPAKFTNEKQAIADSSGRIGQNRSRLIAVGVIVEDSELEIIAAVGGIGASIQPAVPWRK